MQNTTKQERKLDKKYIEDAKRYLTGLYKDLIESLDGDDIFQKQMAYNAMQCIRGALKEASRQRHLLATTFSEFHDKLKAEMKEKNAVHPVYVYDDEAKEDTNKAKAERIMKVLSELLAS